MSKLKKYTNQSVWDATIERLEYVFANFERIYFSCSFGKDSSVMVQAALAVANRLGKLPIHILFIDLEGQYQSTIKHAEEILDQEGITAHWVCLPLNLRNAVSMYQPFWTCWDPDEQDRWIRPMPTHDCVVSDPAFFPFFHPHMEFEQFVVEYGKWYAGGSVAACGVGIRTDESLNRFRTIASKTKERHGDQPWTTQLASAPNVYNFYPIYDWNTEDVWTAVGKNRWSYNKIYDMMYMSGMSIHNSRICQPYGDDQRRGLDLFHRCEPETWFKVVNRVTGANFGAIYARSVLLGFRKMRKPPEHTWKSYAEFLLSTLPRYEQEWFKRKFDRFFWWWNEYYGISMEDVFDEGLPTMEADKKIPTWKRIAKAIISNDKLCKSLSFSQSTRQWEKYMDMKEEYGE